MKHCTYCNTNYAVAETCCPSCGAVDFGTKCDNCGAIHNGAFCPNCGFSINEKPSYCPKCGCQTKDRVCPKCGYDVAATSTVKDAIASVASKAACKIGGHRWLGCKCTRCGETRDESHKFQPIAGKCEQKCSVCGKSESLPHQWNGDKCTRCGSSKGFVDKLWEPVSKRMPFLHLEKESNRVMAGLGIFLVLMFAFLGIMTWLESAPNGNGEIRIPSSSSTFEAKDYRDVMTELQAAGFTNIETETLDDLIIGWLTKDGEVEKVSVNGNTNFSADSKFPEDAKIVITYHTFSKKESEEVSEKTDKTEEVADSKQPGEDSSVQESNSAEESKAYKYDGKPYEIADSHSTGIGFTQYWVYTDGFDYSSDAFREQVKAIITDVAHKENTNKLIVDIVTDKEIVYFESDNTIKEALDKYGMDYFKNTIAPKEKTNWVASYRGGYDSNTSKKSDEDSAFEITWFIADYTDRDDVVFEQWKPNLAP